MDGMRVDVVGIVEDGKYENLTEASRPAMFLPLLQSPASETWLLVRTDRDPQQLATAIKSKLHDLDAGLPSFIQTWNHAMDFALFPSRVAAVSLGLLGMMGAMLSITGIFGMAAYSGSKRMREFGIRMALGGHRRELVPVPQCKSRPSSCDTGPSRTRRHTAKDTSAGSGRGYARTEPI